MVRDMCVPLKDADAEFAKIDGDGSGEIDVEEFAAWYDDFGKAASTGLAFRKMKMQKKMKKRMKMLQQQLSMSRYLQK